MKTLDGYGLCKNVYLGSINTTSFGEVKKNVSPSLKDWMHIYIADHLSNVIHQIWGGGGGGDIPYSLQNTAPIFTPTCCFG